MASRRRTACLARDPARARALITAAGSAAREAIAQARAVMAADRSQTRWEPATPAPGSSLIGARLAWAVMVTVLPMFATEDSSYAVRLHYGVRLTALAIGDIALVVALQLYHSGAARRGRRARLGPVTLALQAILVYAFVFPFMRVYIGGLGSFLAGQQIPNVLTFGVQAVDIGLMVYGLSRLAGLVRQLEDLRGELARVAVVRERLRVARDVHDLLGLGLSALALKADLTGALIGRDDTRTASEIQEMSRICAAARADIRLVTEQKQLSLVAELAAANQILTSAGVGVRVEIPPDGCRQRQTRCWPRSCVKRSPTSCGTRARWPARSK